MQMITPTPLICVIDDDKEVLESLRLLLTSAGHRVKCFSHPSDFLCADVASDAACLILDIHLGTTNGLDFQDELRLSEIGVPVILVSGYGDVPMTVRGMRAGALTFLTKPFLDDTILAAVNEAVARYRLQQERAAALGTIQDRYKALTPRERDLFALVTAGLLNKQIAGKLDLSEITVKIHRGNMVRKMKADSVADLVRMADMLGIRENVTRFNRSPH